MIIKILGTWCAKCKLLEQVTKDAIQQLSLDVQVIKVENMEDILEYDLMATPWLVIDEKVVIAGRVPSKDEIKKLLES